MGGHVGQEHRHGERADAPRPAFAEGVELLEGALDAADGRADMDAGAVGVGQALRQPGVGQGHARRGHGQL